MTDQTPQSFFFTLLTGFAFLTFLASQKMQTVQSLFIDWSQVAGVISSISGTVALIYWIRKNIKLNKEK